MICVTLFCTLRESKNLQPCENHTLFLAVARKSQFSHGSRFFWLEQRAKTCDKIWYLGPLPTLQPVGCTVCVDWTGEIKHRVFPSRLLVAMRRNRLAWGKHATTFAILTQFESQKDFNACRHWAATSHVFFHVKWNFLWNWEEVVADQSSTHCFAPFYNHSLVSE